MDMKVKTLAGEDAGTVTLPDNTFGLEPRPDILHRVVRWQLAARQAGTHHSKRRSEINATGKKMYRQKGTGRARHSDKKATQFRGGAKPHGPRARSHAHDLPKKVRMLGLKHALSAKAKSGDLIVLDEAKLADAKTKAFVASLDKLGLASALFIDGDVDAGFAKAARNVPEVDVLPVAGLNVYDILRRDTLVLTKAALGAIEARLAGDSNGAGMRPADDAAALATAPAAVAAAAVEGAAAGVSPSEGA